MTTSSTIRDVVQTLVASLFFSFILACGPYLPLLRATTLRAFKLTT